MLLQREHRGDSSGDEYDYDEAISSPYYKHAEPQRISQSQSQVLYTQYPGSAQKEEIESVQQSIPLAEILYRQPSNEQTKIISVQKSIPIAEIESYRQQPSSQSNVESIQKSVPIEFQYYPQTDQQQNTEAMKQMIPPFVPIPEGSFMPTSTEEINSMKHGRNPYYAFDFQHDTKSTTETTPELPTKATFSVQKNSEKPFPVPKTGGTPKPSPITKHKSSGEQPSRRKVVVVVRTKTQSSSAPTVGSRLSATRTTSTTTHGSTIPTTISASSGTINVPTTVATKTEPTPTSSTTQSTPSTTKAAPTIKTTTIGSTQASPTAETPKSTSQNPITLRIPMSSQASVTPSPTQTTVTARKNSKSHYPGDPVLMELVRESQVNSVKVKAPSFKDLKGPKPTKQYDLSPDGPVMGLLSSVVEHDNESVPCQKRALCELAIRGTDPKATRFETFMWTLATL